MKPGNGLFGYLLGFGWMQSRRADLRLNLVALFITGGDPIGFGALRRDSEVEAREVLMADSVTGVLRFIGIDLILRRARRRPLARPAGVPDAVPVGVCLGGVGYADADVAGVSDPIRVRVSLARVGVDPAVVVQAVDPV